MAWERVAELLEDREYEQVAQLLHEQQEAVRQAGQMNLVILLAAAYQLCLTCRQFQADRALHQIGLDKARRRERESRRQIQAVLTMLSQLTLPDELAVGERDLDYAKTLAIAKASDTPESEEQLTLLQKIKHLLGFGTGTNETAAEPSAGIDQLETGSLAPIGQEALAEQFQQLIASTTKEEDVTQSGAVSVPVLIAEAEEGSEMDDSSTERKASESPTFTAYCLGPFRVYQDDLLITSWSGLKGQSILKYLIAHHAKPISKDVLMDVFWPDADPKSARRNLHQAIYSVRQILRGERPDFQHIRFEDGFYFLNPMMDIWLDFVEFERQVQVGLRFEAEGQSAAAIKAYGVAEGLYQGDFMEEDIYERWSEVQRENLRTKYLEITDRLAQYYQEHGEYITVVALCRKLLSTDNCHERAHRRLMRCYEAQGQRHLAIRQYQTCRQTLQEELDIPPSTETVALYHHITAKQDV